MTKWSNIQNIRSPHRSNCIAEADALGRVLGLVVRVHVQSAVLKPIIRLLNEKVSPRLAVTKLSMAVKLV